MANQLGLGHQMRRGYEVLPIQQKPEQAMRYVCQRTENDVLRNDEIKYAARLDRNQAQQLFANHPHYKHNLLVNRRERQVAPQRQERTWQTQQQAQHLWNLQRTNKQQFQQQMTLAPMEVKECLEMSGYAPSKFRVNESRRIVGESKLLGGYLPHMPNIKTEYKTSQEQTNALLTQQTFGCTQRQIDLMNEDNRKETENSGIFGTFREEKRAVYNPKKSRAKGTPQFTAKNALLYKNLPGKKSIIEDPQTVPRILLREFEVLKKRSQQTKLRGVLDVGAAAVLHEQFTRLAQVEVYTLRALNEAITLVQTMKERSLRPGGFTQAEAKEQALRDDQNILNLLDSYIFLGNKAEKAVQTVSMNLVSKQVSEPRCMNILKLLDTNWPLNKHMSQREYEGMIDTGSMPDTPEHEFAEKETLNKTATELRKRFHAGKKYEPYSKNLQRETKDQTTHNGKKPIGSSGIY